MHDNIISLINQQVSMDTMRCLTEITSKEKLTAAEKDGYFFGFTTRSWKQSYPEIAPERIYCTKSLAMPSELFYLDKDKCICFSLHIYNGASLINTPEKILHKIADSEKDYAEHKYLALLMPICSEQSGNLAMYMAKLMLTQEKPCQALYDAVLSVYTVCDHGITALGQDGVAALAACKSAKSRKQTLNKLKTLPDEITIYRGEGSESTPYTEASSWSLDIAAAYFFAARLGGDDMRVYRGKVKKADVIEYQDDTREQEILVLAKDVYDVDPIPVTSVSDLQEIAIQSTSAARGYPYPESTYAFTIRDAIDKLYKNIKTEDHTADHTIRVALLASYLFRTDILIPLADAKDKKSFLKACEIYEKLIAAVIYHDSGRRNNIPDSTHGAAGYRKYIKTHARDKVVEFLTTYHCVDSDEEANDYYDKTFNPANKDFIWDAYEIMRDADALDRARFNAFSEDFVNAALLRRESSRALIPVAIQLVNARLH